MTEENKKAKETMPNINYYYAVLKEYIEVCVQNKKTKFIEKEQKGLTSNNIQSKESGLQERTQKSEEKKKISKKKYDDLCDEISKKGIICLSIYVKALKMLYEEKTDWKRDIKRLLINSKSLKLFKDARASIIELYPVLLTVNEIFPIDDYSELSLSPKAAMYGSEVDKSQNSSTKRLPIKNEEYQAMLGMFQFVKDQKRFGEWLMAILFFTSDRLLDDFKEEYIPERECLKKWAYKQIESNAYYKRSIEDYLFKNKVLSDLIDAFVSKTSLEKRQAEIEEENKKEKAQHEERRAKQFEIIQQRDVEVEELRNKIKDFERCRCQLTSYMQKYQTQVSMNERITNDNDRRIKEMEEDYDCMQDELTEARTQLNELKIMHTALEADFSLKNNELQNLKNMVLQKTESARIGMRRELVSGINEQFFYLTMFYLELKDTGKLEPESIELYANTLRNIDGVLSNLGINKIGEINQLVKYDASIHVSTDAKLSNGDNVIVSGYGWKIGDQVYIKAPVEKGEQ